MTLQILIKNITLQILIIIQRVYEITFRIISSTLTVRIQFSVINVKSADPIFVAVSGYFHLNYKVFTYVLNLKVKNVKFLRVCVSDTHS